MDVILDLCETFVGDHVFAWLHPAQPGAHSHIVSSNYTSPSPYGLPCHYEPPTKYFTIAPSPAACMSSWPRDNVFRQSINLFLIFWLFGTVVYLLFATLSYVFVFDKEMEKHPKYLKNQPRMEIEQSLWALPGMSVLTLPFSLAEARGYTKLYDTSADGPGLWYDVLQYPLFILFTDFSIYWIHRGLHHPLVYKALHKKHHRWVMPTPYAAYAFHPADGWAQSLPYHVFVLLFPMQKFAFVALFVLVNFWAILIHDGDYLANNPLINGAACHTVHHLCFNYNYGQYTTLWDRLAGSHRAPQKELFRKDTRRDGTEWQRQCNEVEDTVRGEQGNDDGACWPAESKKSV
ncbi:uncharacterized protein UV8b_08216 [Ustilaginoidea virens]|uniref:Fatty acid hydroxylase domain-containing protein n=1 Tax=Ustilaginoidea virens TaxID=1159556 RepID=A0A063C5Q3_USTVR|nr:uncharacterized protein UV8b_08216 [Ustilaginoidea virens]QUC23975.1 hypothetical protein UV8b_08216 [Ustilaginoidea virens]GAO16265.1 hypothetical protein UVI_02000430 [Ustilaginoidea virens]